MLWIFIAIWNVQKEYDISILGFVSVYVWHNAEIFSVKTRKWI